MGSCSHGELPPWGAVLVGNSPGGREMLLSSWGKVVGGSCPGGELFWLRVVLE